MKKSLKGSKTLVNLMKSFAGESQASMRYKYYAKQAEKEAQEAVDTKTEFTNS